MMSLLALFGVAHMYYRIDNKLNDFENDFTDAIERKLQFEYARRDSTDLEIRSVKIRFDGIQAAINELKVILYKYEHGR